MMAFKCMIVAVVAIVAFPTTKALSLMGQCRYTPATDASMNFDEFANENNGVWQVTKVVNSTFNSGLESLSYDVSPTSESGVYKVNMNYRSTDGTSGVFADEEMSGFNQGFILSSGLVSDVPYTLKIYFLKYEPGQYAYYYVCSDDGEDTDNDYRYILTQNGLRAEQEQAISDIESAYGFQGALVSL